MVAQLRSSQASCWGGMDIGTLPVDLNGSKVVEIDSAGCDGAAAEELEPAQEAIGGEGDDAGEGGSCDAADPSAGEADPAADHGSGVHLLVPSAYGI